jgi:hypothetical protein
MNIKKFLIISSIVLQVSTSIYADQTAWNKAFLAFGGGSDPVAAANSITANSQSASSALTSVTTAGKTPEAYAVGHYVATSKTSFTNKSIFTDTDVVNAIKAANGTPLPKGDNVNANWTTAINAFGGANGISAKTTTIRLATCGITSTNFAYGNAQVIDQFLTNAAMNQTDASTLTTQLGLNTSGAPSQKGDNVAANWTTAINAFGGAAGISAKTATKTMPVSITSASAAYNDAQVILQYVTSAAMNATDVTNLNAALVANGAPAQKGDAINANWTTAITAFGGATGISAKTTTIRLATCGITSTNAAYGNAQVIDQFLTNAAMNQTDASTLTTQLALNTNNAPLPKGDNVNANWTTAITAFGGATGISAKTTAIRLASCGIASTNVAYGNAQVIDQFLTNAAMNQTDASTLTTQLGLNTSSATTTDAAAVALKTQINASIDTLNLYNTSKSLPSVQKLV